MSKHAAQSDSTALAKALHARGTRVHDIPMPLLFLKLPAIRGSPALPASQPSTVDVSCSAVMLHFRRLWHFLCWGAVAAVVGDGV